MAFVRNKILTMEEALEYVAYAVLMRDLPDEFDGDITCEINEDGEVEIYAVQADDSESTMVH